MSSLLSNDRNRLGYGTRTGSKNKTKVETVTDIIMSCGSSSSQIEMIKKALQIPVIADTCLLIIMCISC